MGWRECHGLEMEEEGVELILIIKWVELEEGPEELERSVWEESEV